MQCHFTYFFVFSNCYHRKVFKIQHTKIVATVSPAIHSDLSKDSSPRKVDFFASRARIRKHSVEAEKSTFRGELSFQRSECTAGLTVATATEHTECWPGQLFDILYNKYFPAGWPGGR
jgi:hypothetical protein